MSQVIVDPSELRKFETALRELSGEIEARRRQLEQRVSQTASFWKGEKHTEFVRRQEELSLEIQVFYKLCDRYCTFLQKKAAAADAYLGR